MKKQFFNAFVFASIFSMNFIGAVDVVVANQDGFAAPLVDNSGTDRIVNIMSQIKHNVVPGVVEPITYAQASNIDQDLNISAIANFFNCKTVMGNAFLRETLQRPVAPIDQSGIVALRTAAVQALVDNPDLKQHVEAMLQSAAEQEKVAIELMSNSFRGQTCPEFEALKKMKENNDPNYWWINSLLTDRIWKTGLYTFSVAMLSLSSKLAYEYGNTAMQLAVLKRDCTYYALFAAYFGIGAGWGACEHFREHIKSNKKREKMHALNQLIHVAESIEELSYVNNIATQFKIGLISDNAGMAMVEGLKASRYENETDYLFLAPAVDTFLYKVFESDTQLAQIFASIAEMDAYNAIATKILEGRNSQRKFCFANKIESAQPQVLSQGFWNVLVPNAVINNIDMNQHVILTGPNAGGKTTSIRANLQNIVLAQTYGVAAAEQFDYTQFDIILSYLNISDDLVNGLSLFASEVKRAKDLLEIIKAMTPGQKLFFALDELFTGTAAEQGEKCAYEFIKKTATYDNTLFVYATHFDKLKQLGKQNIGLMNYKVDAPIKNQDGKLVYPFTLSPGASTVNVAEDMAKEAGLFD